MKRHFGSSIRRFLRGGHRLNDAEFHVLTALIAALPAHLRPVVESQFEAYDLVQREVDGRALNFYRTAKTGEPFPTLQGAPGESPLVRASFSLPDGETVHAVLTAVAGLAFCVTLDKPLSDAWRSVDLTLGDVRPSWRSGWPAKAS